MRKTNWPEVQDGPKFGMRRVITAVVWRLLLGAAILLISAYGQNAGADELEAVIRAGKLRHIGVPYANFVISADTGLDVELVRAFAEHLGVQYEFVGSSWSRIIADLSGQSARVRGDDVEIIAEAPVRGDLIAAGLTVIAWRQKLVDFSTPTFPTGAWLVARADSDLQPIIPSGDIDQDVRAVKMLLRGKSVLGLQASCLDPTLYALDGAGALVKYFPENRSLDEMIPAVMAGMAETTLMDVPVALIALEKWPGKIKVIGPLSAPQEMACAFPKSAPNLRRAFDAFFAQFKADGNYDALVRKYYPSVFSYSGSFFKG